MSLVETEDIRCGDMLRLMSCFIFGIEKTSSTIWFEMDILY